MDTRYLIQNLLRLGLVGFYQSDLGVTLNAEAITNPNAFDNAAWLKGNATVSANVTTDPLGGNQADSLVEDGTLNNHFIDQAVTNKQAGLLETWSVYARASGRHFMALGDDTGAHWQWFDLTAGTMGTQAGLAGATMTNVGNGWYWLTVSSTGFDSAFTIFMGSADNTPSYQGNGTGNIFLWGAAVDQGRLSQWSDQSGKGNHLVQATAANQALYRTGRRNGRPSILFDGVNDTVGLSFTLNQPTTVACSYIPVAIGATGVNDGVIDGGTTTAALIESTVPDVNITAGATLSTNATLTAGSPLVASYVLNGATSTLRLRRTAATNEVTGAAGANNPAGITVGALATPARWTNIEVQMLAAFNTLLFRQNRLLIEKVFAAYSATAQFGVAA